MEEIRFVKIKDRPDLIKDTESGALINVNRKAIDDYKAKKAAIAAGREAQKEINRVIEEVDGIKKDVADIKHLLQKLLEK